MDKVKINMIGGGFQHEICSSAGNVPRYVEWDKGSHSADISIHIDNAIRQPTNKIKRNYAWICESSAIIPHIIQWVSQNMVYMENNYELIFTHDERLLSLSPKMRFILPNAVPWVSDYGVHKKTKLVSIIASLKKYCSGHLYRHTIIEKYGHLVDCYGSGHNRIENKEEGLNDYCFSIAMENDNYPHIFCEKITDCFATGTIPIFWGTPTIGDFFNKDGIIMLTDDFMVEDLSTDLYYSKMDAILNNYERAINLPTAEDYMYENHIK